MLYYELKLNKLFPNQNKVIAGRHLLHLILKIPGTMVMVTYIASSLDII